MVNAGQPQNTPPVGCSWVAQALSGVLRPSPSPWSWRCWDEGPAQQADHRRGGLRGSGRVLFVGYPTVGIRRADLPIGREKLRRLLLDQRPAAFLHDRPLRTDHPAPGSRNRDGGLPASPPRPGSLSRSTCRRRPSPISPTATSAITSRSRTSLADLGEGEADTHRRAQGSCMPSSRPSRLDFASVRDGDRR